MLLEFPDCLLMSTYYVTVATLDSCLMIIKHLHVYCTCLLNDNYFMVMNFINVIIMNFITCQYFDDIF